MKRLIVFALGLLLLGAGCQQPTQEDYVAMGRTWIETSAPTFVDDGSDLQFQDAQQGSCATCWELWYTFTSAAAGFGDRTDQASAQVITPHGIRLKYVRGTLVEAVIDEQWDELNQRELSGLILPEGTGDQTFTVPAP